MLIYLVKKKKKWKDKSSPILWLEPAEPQKQIQETRTIPDQWQTKTTLSHVPCCFAVAPLSLSLSLSPILSLSPHRKTASTSLRRSLSDRLEMSTGDLLSIEPQELQFPCKLSQNHFFLNFAFTKLKNCFFLLSDPWVCFLCLFPVFLIF